MNISVFAECMFRYSKVIAGNKPDFTDEDVLDFWYQALQNIPLEILGPAIRKLCTGLHFPTIADILKACGQVEFTEDDIAREFVAKLVNYVARFGYTNEAEAKKEIGEKMWAVVESIGGWQYICNFDSYDDFNFMIPQWRETAKVCLKRQSASQNKLALGDGYAHDQKRIGQ